MDVFRELDVFTTASQLYRALMRTTENYIFVCDMKQDKFFFPPEMVEEFALPGNIVEGAISVWGQKIHEKDRASFYHDMENMVHGASSCHVQEYRVRNRFNRWVWVRCNGQLLRDTQGAPSMFAGVITNLQRRGKIDPISNLPNRFEFEKRISEHLKTHADTGGIALLNLDDFRAINHLYGREFGDEVLRITGQQLRTLLPESVRLYRLEGDCFGIFSPNLDETGWQQLYDTVFESFQNHKTLQGKKYYCTISAGCVCFPADPVSHSDLYKRAEHALDFAKASGRNQLCLFHPTLLDGQARLLTLTELLREDVENGMRNFEVAYQPQMDAKTGGLVGAEALLRWSHEQYGSVSPVEFIPILERTGLIHTAGNWVLRASAQTCVEFRALTPHFIMSVNASYLQLMRPDFLTALTNVLSSTGLAPEALHLELTESCLVSGSQFVQESFEKIRALGVQIAMDDFGTGYSSLSTLKHLPADIVKIDRSFVKNITTSEFDMIFIRFIVRLCHNIKILVCLEGVEKQEELEALHDAGLDWMQGFYFGRPCSKTDFVEKFLTPGPAA